MTSYIALLRKDADSDYGVDFPDFPGCVTAGRTLDEARRMAEEALELHLEGLLEDGGKLPKPSKLEDVSADPANKDALPFLVQLQGVGRESIRVSVTMPEADLRAIDAWARRHGMSRSAALTQAARRLLAEVD